MAGFLKFPGAILRRFFYNVVNPFCRGEKPMARKLFGARDHLEIVSLGMEFALIQVLFVGVGYWFDVKFGTLPWCLLAGAFIGFALGITHIVSIALEANKKKNGRF